MSETSSGSERRRFPRFPVEVPVQVLYPGYWDDSKGNPLLGTTLNLSEGGVCFTIHERIPHREVVLHIDYQGMGAEYIHVQIVEERAVSQSSWQYHCQLLRSLGSVDPMAVFESSDSWQFPSQTL